MVSSREASSPTGVRSFGSDADRLRGLSHSVPEATRWKIGATPRAGFHLRLQRPPSAHPAGDWGDGWCRRRITLLLRSAHEPARGRSA